VVSSTMFLSRRDHSASTCSTFLRQPPGCRMRPSAGLPRLRPRSSHRPCLRVTRDIPVNCDSRLTAPGGLDCQVPELAEVAEQIQRSGPLATERVLDYARQAWEAAHEKASSGCPRHSADYHILRRGGWWSQPGWLQLAETESDSQ
jgi:hypothetical protein